MAAIEQTTPVVPEWSFGERLAKARRHAGLTQEQMAELLGRKPSTIASWENETRQPRRLMALVAEWSRITGIDREWILGSRTGSVALAAVSLTDAEQMELDLYYEERRRPSVVRF